MGGHSGGKRTSEEVIPGGRNTGKVAEEFEYQFVIFIFNLIIAVV